MKSRFLLIAFVISALSFGQNQFVFSENGLDPEYIVTPVDSTSPSILFQKTLEWAKSNFTGDNTAIDSQPENNSIHLTGYKNNAVNEGKLYYSLKYRIKISFEKGQYTFEPTEVLLKLNSKYDMGWKAFDLKNGTPYFKRGKVIRNLKSYVYDIPAVLNDVNTRLYQHLKAEE